MLVGEGPLRPMLEQRVKALGMALGPGQAVEMPGAVTEPSEALRGPTYLFCRRERKA